MEHASMVDFAEAARRITRHVRREGLIAPSFRCPPRLVGADRTIRRRQDGAVVSVRVHDRPLAAVLADMIEGVVVANQVATPQSDRIRADLWDLVGVADGSSAPTLDSPRPDRSTSPARRAA